MTATDAYRAWVAAHPSLDALTDEQKDHEAALAMGLETRTHPRRGHPQAFVAGSGWTWWTPHADAAQAVELLSGLAKSRGWRVHIMIDDDGTVTCFITARLGTRRLANVIDTSEPRARTHACLAAMRGALEDDDGF